MVILLLISVLAFLAPGCGNDDGGPIPDGNSGICSVGMSFASVHDQIFSGPKCSLSGCHGSRFTQGGLDFSLGKAVVYDELLNGGTFETVVVAQFPQRVIAGQAEQSFLWLKVSEANPPGGNFQMPQGGPPLSSCELDGIRGWITAGAPNN